jgi:hypothetical protein
MANNPTLDDDDVDLPPRGATREKLKAFVQRRYSTRVHMALILVSSGFASMIASWTLLHAGVHAMLVRYPVAITASYLTFLLGVWVWLRATGLGSEDSTVRERMGGGRRFAKNGGFDLPIGGGGGSSGGGGGSAMSGLGRGGGAFDGGGASASFSEGNAPMMGAAMSQPDPKPGWESHVRSSSSPSSSSSSSSSSSKSGFNFGLDIDGDGLVLLVLAVLLVVAIFCCSGYLVYTAPDVLTEAAFGATLTGTLARPAHDHGAGGWVAGVLRKTWWPFAIVMVLALAFAGWSAAHYPHATTFKEALAAALHSHQEN